MSAREGEPESTMPPPAMVRVLRRWGLRCREGPAAAANVGYRRQSLQDSQMHAQGAVEWQGAWQEAEAGLGRRRWRKGGGRGSSRRGRWAGELTWASRNARRRMEWLLQAVGRAFKARKSRHLAGQEAQKHQVSRLKCSGGAQKIDL